MDSTISALTGLYVALGGNANTVANITVIPDMINAITALIAGGSTTATDNGKILTVVSGKWAAATPASNTNS